MRSLVEQARGREGRGLSGRVAAGGARSRELFGLLLGLDVAGPPHEVTAVAWIDHAVEAAVALDRAGAVAVARFENRGPDSQGFVLTDRLALYYRLMGHELPRRLAHVTEQIVPRRIEGWSLERLMAALQADPELGRPGQPLPPGVDEQERPRSLLDTWGDPTAWADFFAGGEMSRAQLDSLDPTSLYSFVQHSDAECNHVNPHSVAPIVWLVNYPWEGPARRRVGASGIERQSFSGVEALVCSNLTESDVIQGNPDKLDRVLARAVENQKRDGKPIFFSNTCVPVVVGEDVESRLDRCRARTGCKMHYLTVTPRSMVNVFEDELVGRRLAAEQQAGAPVEGRLNLVGFARDAAHAELAGLIAASGIELGVSLLPDLDEALLAALPQAALNVFYPNQLWQHLYDQLLLSTGIPHIEPPAPFGFAAGERWLVEIGARLGREEAAREVWQAHTAPLQAEWAALREEAAGHRVALVVRAEESYFLTRPAATWGIPVLSLLEEMGFGLDVFLKVRDRESARRAAGEVHAQLAEPRRHRIQAFDDFARMMGRLEDSQAGALLSAHFFDWRATRNGMSPLSLQVFEMGPQGALRSARRILDVCRTPFFRRFARFLGRTGAGLRVPYGGQEGA